MPQIFQTLRCYKCLTFQIHQTKKSNKFECKMCGEKQSIKRHYGIGTAKDCRLHVQRLNGIRGEIDDLKETVGPESDEENEPSITVANQVENTQSRKSKWSDYVDKNDEEVEQTEPELDNYMYLNNTEVVLEHPKKRRRTNFRCPSKKVCIETDERPIYKENVSNNALSMNSHTETNYITYSKIFKHEDMPNISIKSAVKLESHIEVQKHIQPPTNTTKEVVTKIPPAFQSNSKWARFVEEEQEKEETVEDNDNLILNSESFQSSNVSQDFKDVNEHEALILNNKNSKELFALCDDSDLDNVLDI